MTLRGVLLGLALVGFAQLLPDRRGGAVAVSETEGEILLAYVQFDRRAADAVGPAYRALFAELRDAEVIVGCPTEEDWAAFRSQVAEGRGPERFRPLVMNRPISPWAKDRFIATRLPDGRLRLLVPHRPPHAAGAEADWRVAWDVARLLRGDVRVLKLDFDGGDVWVAGGRAFVHRSVLERNGVAAPERLLARELGAEPVVIDGPPHHIGMFATPLHDGRVVAGPALALDGFEVTRLPFEKTEIERVYVTYNNVIVSGGRVFMPVFEAPTDDRAEEVWRGLGFDVVRIPCAKLYRAGGTVHCLVNVLGRSGP